MAVREAQRALRVLAEQLRDEDSVISPHVRDTDAAPGVGVLVASGPRAARAPEEYALLVESIREGYLLHYGEPRVVVGAVPDLALLAGDYLYARGLERLARLGDLAAVRELSDLISLSAQIHADGNGTEPAGALWLASAVAVAAGGGEEHELAKDEVRRRRPGAARSLLEVARAAAASSGIIDPLTVAADSVGFGLREDVPEHG